MSSSRLFAFAVTFALVLGAGLDLRAPLSLPLASAAEEDHPLVSRYADSRLRLREDLALDEYDLVVGPGEQRELETLRLEGRVTKQIFDNPGGRSTLEISRNYRDALAAQGMELLFECRGREECAGTQSGRSYHRVAGINIGNAGDHRYFAGKLPYGEGEAHVAVMVTPQRSWVYVIESAAMETGLVTSDASSLAADLDQAGSVRLDGIYFDTGLATLQPESDAALAEVAELLRQRPELRLLVVGHTDSVGSDADNLKLSRRRAAAVVAALTGSFGVAADRLESRGMGSGEPAASNDTEEGRALNRRVELVRQ